MIRPEYFWDFFVKIETRFCPKTILCRSSRFQISGLTCPKSWVKARPAKSVNPKYVWRHSPTSWLTPEPTTGNSIRSTIWSWQPQQKVIGILFLLIDAHLGGLEGVGECIWTLPPRCSQNLLKKCNETPKRCNLCQNKFYNPFKPSPMTFAKM